MMIYNAILNFLFFMVLKSNTYDKNKLILDMRSHIILKFDLRINKKIKVIHKIINSKISIK